MPHVGIFSKVTMKHISRQDSTKPIIPSPQNILMKTDLGYLCAYKLNLLHT